MVVLINILIIILGFLRPLRTLGGDAVSHALFDFLGQPDDENGNIFHNIPPFTGNHYGMKMA